MTFPEWTKPGIYGAVVGAIAITVFGFNWGGWTTHTKSQALAAEMSENEVTMAMVPVCMDMAATDPERIGKLAALRDLSGFDRRNAMMETGWATRPGTDTPDRDLATACLTGLGLDGS
ncbi:hypothetical protein [Celeribacter sp.]|uniref:hypothetical protein n=1 Tax=Celeribacter sp. TaxID=1890673 RepID=UPI003A94DE5C